MAGLPSGRLVVLLAFPGVQALDLVGPMEVFTGASSIAAGAYEVQVAAPGPGGLGASSGLMLLPAGDLPDVPAGIDTLLVCGGPGAQVAERDERLIGWLRDAAGRSRRIASVCTGALLLARAGLLDGRRATTHWAACQELAERYPQVTVERDAIFVRDGRVWTSAGVTAGMDLALALVEEDLGRDVALEIARWLVLFVKRPGGQSQFSSHLAGQRPRTGPLREVTDWIQHNLAADLRVEALAERACMSPRNFSRTFGRETGMTPAKYVEIARVQAARQALADTADGVEAVAARCGFGTAETMRRAFHRHLGTGPADYRARFSSALQPAMPGPATRETHADRVPALRGLHSA
jgi:transcriptional regulator GlxA family with amidase domain